MSPLLVFQVLLLGGAQKAGECACPPCVPLPGIALPPNTPPSGCYMPGLPPENPRQGCSIIQKIVHNATLCQRGWGRFQVGPMMGVHPLLAILAHFDGQFWITSGWWQYVAQSVANLKATFACAPCGHSITMLCHRIG